MEQKKYHIIIRKNGAHKETSRTEKTLPKFVKEFIEKDADILFILKKPNKKRNDKNEKYRDN